MNEPPLPARGPAPPADHPTGDGHGPSGTPETCAKIKRSATIRASVLSRRDFLRGCSTCALGSLLIPSLTMLSACGPPGGDTIPNQPGGSYAFEFATYPQLAQAGGTLFVQVNATSGTVPVAIVRASATAVDAVQAICTHAGCTLNPYDGASQTFACPCHGSVFSAAGAVLQGPAFTPLLTYPAQLGVSAITVRID